MDKTSYFYLAHCENGSPSSKRLYGGIGFTTFQVCLLVATVLSLVMTHELSSTIKDLLEVDLITSASLLGLSTITGIFGGNKVAVGKNNEGDEESE